jgi:predicted Zn-dependent protease
VLSGGEQRVAELLVEAGGAPSFRPARPSSDFEHTKVSNSRALAQQMQLTPEEPARPRSPRPSRPAPAPGDAAARASKPDVKAPGAGLGAVEPTIIEAAPMGARAAAEASRGAAEERRVDVAGRVATALASLRRRPNVAVGAGLALVVLVIAIAVLPRAGRAPSAADVANASLRARAADAIARGSLAALSAARDELGPALRLGVEPGAPDPGLAADAALVEAFLAADHGVSPSDQLAHLELPVEAPARDRARALAARGLFAFARGDLDEAARAAARALELATDALEARVLLARVHLVSGRLDDANRALELVLAASATTTVSTAVVDWATLLAEQGKLVDAEGSLRPLVDAQPDLLVARALLARVARAQGRKTPALDGRACVEQGARAKLVAAWCRLDAVEVDRLEGKRAEAAREARSVLELAPTDGRVLVAAALALAALGEIDAAADALDRARKLTGGELPSLGWAERGVTLARREPPPKAPPGPVSSLDAALVSLRLAYASGGAAAVTLALRDVPPGALALDDDLRALSLLAREARPTPTIAQELAEKADAGNPVAAFVAGKLARHAGDARLAAKRLERALVGHADGCLAAVDYAAVLRQLGRAAGPTAPPFAPVRKHNARCRWD